VCWLGVHCGIYGSLYNVLNISYLNSPPLLLSFFPFFHHSWNSFNRYHFCIYVLYLHHIHLPVPFPTSYSVPLVSISPLGYSALLFSGFVEEKRRKQKVIFCLFGIIFFYMCGTGAWTQRLTFARQPLYHLSPCHHPCLFEIKVATQGISLWYIHVYIYCKPNWLLSSVFLHYTLVPFLWWF
jgi:hypothetical protein